ncbi:MAG: ABC transporter permease [Synergistaceae bacterium]|jgi:simple sugar transport system permease protein|nr:ABC transporter permease [Synergistaceae bacterium]
MDVMDVMDAIPADGLSFAMPLLIMAIGGIYCERGGVLMLALEGLQGFGAFTGALSVVLCLPLLGAGSPCLVYIAMAGAMIGGMSFSLLHALLCVRFKAQQVISGMVINTLAMALTTFLTSVVNEALTSQVSNRFQIGASERFTLPILSRIPIFGGFFRNMYPFELVILAVAFVSWHVLYKTRFGLRLRACGENPHSLDAAGGNVGRTRVIAIMICGALAGLGGIFVAYSVSANFSPSIYMGYGYMAIAAMIFGNWKISPTFAVCMFFGLTKSAGYQICLWLGMTSNYTDLLLVIPYVVTLVLLVFFSKRNQPPRALGDPFDKGKR